MIKLESCNAAPPDPAFRVWVLGAPDPEMVAISGLLGSLDECYGYAVKDGKRCHPGNAYRADDISDGIAWGAVTHLVECGGVPEAVIRDTVVRIDHHREGDPGYGCPPKEYLGASSIGQVVAELAKLNKIPCSWTRDYNESYPGQKPGDTHNGWVATGESGHYDSPWAEIPRDLLIVAAADHCLGAAYAGQCPEVDPEKLREWRGVSRAAFQERSVADVMLDVDRAVTALGDAPRIWGEPVYSPYDYPCPHCDTDHHPDCMRPPAWGVCDMRGAGFVPELPEAAAQEGVAFVAQMKDRDGRTKVVLQAAPPVCVRAFLDGKIVPDLMDLYGDPARGFAGGYIV